MQTKTCTISAFPVRKLTVWPQVYWNKTETRQKLSSRSLSPVLLGEGQRDEVFCLFFFLLSGVCTQQAACHTGCKLPWCPHASFFRSLPPPITVPYLGVLLESWLHLGPSRLGAISVIGSAADFSPLYSLSFVLCPRINSELPREQKKSWDSCEKRK